MAKKLIVVIVVVVLAVGAGLWWFVVRDDAPEELSVDGGSSSTDAADGDTATAPESLDGTWVVETGGDTTAGFRIEESFAGGLTDHTAVGRSDEVSGSFVVDGDSVSDGSFTVDLTALEFTDDPGLPVGNRVGAMEDRGLETNQFPDATFKITEPATFDGDPLSGDTVTAEVTGVLTLHGVTNPVTFTVEAKVDGDTVRVATAEPVPVVLADYGITPPTGGPIAEVSDEGSFEFLVVLTAA
jgi:polyisoprenoid-binding protein YceI